MERSLAPKPPKMSVCAQYSRRPKILQLITHIHVGFARVRTIPIPRPRHGIYFTTGPKMLKFRACIYINIMKLYTV